MESIFHQLREKLDGLSVGFPKTEDEVEIKILRMLFTEDEAKMFIGLSPFFETSDEVAERLGQDSKYTSELLEKMSKKGLLFRIRRGETLKYSVIPYVPGIFEYQANRMDEKLAKAHEEYFELKLSDTIQSVKTALLRTIPLNKSLVPNNTIAPYEDVMAIIEGHNTIAVSSCICRTTTRHANTGCNKTLENCFQFGVAADYIVENGLGRYIGKDEALAILKNNEKEGFVMQPYNAQKMGALCSCCGDCCEILRSIKLSAKPVDEVNSNYYAYLEKKSCSGCEICLDRCQMDAITIIDDVANINLDRCIGCGLCASTCPENVIHLIQKAADTLYSPPKNTMDTFLKIAEERNIAM
jgi:ferredoxin